MILIGIGGNLPSQFGPVKEGLEQVLKLLEEQGSRLIARSPWYGAHAVPRSDQPDFVNGVVRIETTLPPEALLKELHILERLLGRIRGKENAARTLDLDILAYNQICGDFEGEEGWPLKLPHPRMHHRAFVLAPLCDIAPEWLHPRLQITAAELYASLPEPLGIWRL